MNMKKTLTAVALSTAVSTSVFAACTAPVNMGGQIITNAVVGTQTYVANAIDFQVANRKHVEEYVAAFITDGSTSTAAIESPHGLLVDIDGNQYATKEFTGNGGNQVWMMENLRTTRNADGSAISNVIANWADGNNNQYAIGGSSGTLEDDDEATQKANGYYYQWSAAMNSSTATSAQGACPTGWHVPSDMEWNGLEMNLGADGSCNDGPNGYRYGTNGGVDDACIDASGTASNIGTIMQNNGFSSAAGTRNLTGSMDVAGSGFYWTSTQLSGTRFVYYSTNPSKAGVTRTNGPGTYGMSIRCVKD